tara:strand:+ start:749 stop:1183 length:435 start_codon:yes stop_codon:yes gene_type:complete
MRTINEIIIHCTATRPGWMADSPAEDIVAEITRWHVEDRGWSDCGYSHIISRSGEVGAARPEHRVGAHCRGRNKHSLGISLCGGRGGAADDAFEDNFTPAQEAALRDLIADLKQKYPTITKVSGHSEFSSKACPCFSVEDWLIG